MQPKKSIKFLLLPLLIAFFLCDKLPTNPYNPDNSDCTIQLTSIYYGVNDTLIEDSLGGTVSLLIRYRLPQFIDSITIKLQPLSLVVNSAAKFDTSFSLKTFSTKDNDTAVFNLKLTTEGKNNLQVACHINNGKVVYDSAVIIVHRRAVSNQPPVANDLEIKSKEDNPVNVKLFASDRETAASELQYTLSKQPLHGKIAKFVKDSLLYTPDSNYAGTDSFTYVTFDGTLYSNIAVVTITISPVNDTPTVLNQSLSTGLNTPITFQLHGSDIESNILIFDITRLPQHGSLDTSNSLSLTFTPSNNYKCIDTVFFKAIDEQGLSSLQGSVVIFIASENQKPVAQPVTVNVDEDSSIIITLSGVDIETSTRDLKYTIYTQPVNGTLGVISGN